MSKKTYKYNPDSLNFEPIDKGCKGKIFRIISIFFGGLICITAMYLFYSANFETVKEKRLALKNQQLIEKYQGLNEQLALLETELQEIGNKDDKIYRAVLGKKPLGQDLRNAGIGGSDRYERFEKFENYELLKNTTQNLEVLMSKIKIQDKSFNEVSKELKEQELTLDGKPTIKPVSKKDYRRISSTYGYRTDPVHGGKRMHKGLDFAGPIGINIYSTGDGVVYRAGYNTHGYGNEVIVKHHGGYMTRYGHMKTVTVKAGEKIKRGQKVGELGNTGKSTGPHLHYEVIKNGNKVNPANYFFNNLSIEEFEQIVKFSQEN